jgi:hypothetical protein
MEQGWDPEVKKYFQKIMSTFGYCVLWMMSAATAGIYFRLGYLREYPLVCTILFYFLLLTALILLIRYLYRTWKNG